MPRSHATLTRLTKIGAMGPAELLDRTAQTLLQRWDALRARLAGPPRPSIRHPYDESRTPRFFFAPNEVMELVEIIRARLPSEVAALIARADALREHRFGLLGYGDLDYGPKIDWHFDAVSGRRAPLVPWYRIRLADFDQVGDPKVTWELNRHQHLVTLARAYRLTGDPSYAAEISAQLHDWERQNPYPLGINWASALEVAFRSLSWLWVRHLLEATPGDSAELRACLQRGLSLSGRHIERYLSRYTSPNTHLLGEAVGLFFIGVLVPEVVAAERWRARAWRIILQEAERQVRDDGLHFEKSTYYHVYALDLFLHARILAQRNGIAGVEQLDRSVTRQLDALRSLAASGVAFCFGDDDGGRVFDGRRNHTEHLLDPLATGALLYDDPDLRALAAGVREETIWLLGVDGVRPFEQQNVPPSGDRSEALDASGVYLMQCARGARLCVSAGDFGMPAGGHGHADLLNAQVASGDRIVLGDSGTFVYNADDDSRDLFRATGAHNTLTMDGRSQAEPRGPFSWERLPCAEVVLWVTNEIFDLFVARHDAYSAAASRTVHERWIVNLKSDFFVVRDLVEGSGGVHDLEIRWHLGDHGAIEEKGAGVHVLTIDRRELVALVTPQGSRWQTRHRESWGSPVYGRRNRRPALCLSAATELPAETVTLMQPLDDEDTPHGLLRRISTPDAAPEAPSGYVYELGDTTHLLFFGRGENAWRCEEWESDAHFVYCRIDKPSGQVSEGFVIGGSRLRRENETYVPRAGQERESGYWRLDAPERRNG